MDEEDTYAKDGTVDFRGDPAVKNETGTWKACPYILGIACFYRNPAFVWRYDMFVLNFDRK